MERGISKLLTQQMKPLKALSFKKTNSMRLFYFDKIVESRLSRFVASSKSAPPLSKLIANVHSIQFSPVQFKMVGRKTVIAVCVCRYVTVCGDKRRLPPTMTPNLN